jgi:predicted acylesterase/phospholipase RssA
MTKKNHALHAEKVAVFKKIWLFSAICLPLALAACSNRRMPAVPQPMVSRAQPQIDNVRFNYDLDYDKFEAEWIESNRREIDNLRSTGYKDDSLPPAVYLSISGGGANGAFGAGLLTGWTGAGRPVFKSVTGTSTGALIAPFAFLGPKYDSALRQLYTTTTDKDIYDKRWLIKGAMSDALADTLPLQKLEERYLTPEFLAEIAAEYAKGRLLLVGTTNLDTQSSVIWNMTAIAASKDPNAIVLFRKIILASAAIPGAFPPVMIDVTVDGKKYQEMHVDGGASAQVFVYPARFHLAEASGATAVVRQRTLYIIRNDRLDPDWASVAPRTLTIASEAISSLIHHEGNGDLYRMYLTAQRDHLDYRLAFIPADFNAVSKSEFDTVYMNQLFTRGQEMAAKGYPWQNYPPGYAPDPHEEQRQTHSR